MKKYIVECLSTFALTLTVLLSLIKPSFPIPTVALAGLLLVVFVYSIGHISGAHLNPAVTLGALSIKKIKVSDALVYIIAQVVGAFVAMVVVYKFFGLPIPGLFVGGSVVILMAEAIGTFFFTFGIASVIYGSAPNQMSGIVIGGSLVLGILMASALGSNGVLNPAVAIGIGSFNWAYLLGPIIGAVAGMQAYKAIDEK